MRKIGQERKQWSIVSIGIVLFTLVTAGGHFYLGMQPDEDLRIWFLLNSMGYIGCLFLYYLPALRQFRLWIGGSFFAYTVLTIGLWLFLSGIIHGEVDPFDITVKSVEVLLAICLLINIPKRKEIFQSEKKEVTETKEKQTSLV